MRFSSLARANSLGSFSFFSQLSRKTVDPSVGVKAAGDIRTYADALRMIKERANRIGTSSAAAITAEAH
jgi:deoxyribose-phosphate aldolase